MMEAVRARVEIAAVARVEAGKVEAEGATGEEGATEMAMAREA